jgi:hypothetical protein
MAGSGTGEYQVLRAEDAPSAPAESSGSNVRRIGSLAG